MTNPARDSVQALCLVALLCGGLCSQQTWVVDPSGLGNFTSMPPAIAAAAPHDTIVVRPGSYAPFVVDRSLHFVGEGRPTFQSFSNSTATTGHNLSLSGVDILYCNVYSAVCTFEGVRFDYRCDILSSSGVMVDCENAVTGAPYDYATVNLAASNYAFDACTFGGTIARTFGGIGCSGVLPARSALVLTGNSTATVTGCTMTGGASAYSTGCGVVPASPAIDVGAGSSVRLTWSVVNSGGFSFTGPEPIANNGPATAVVVDPTVQFNIAQSNVTAGPVPALTGQGDIAGGMMTCLLATAAQRPAAIVASIGSRAPVPSPFGPAWVDLNVYVVLTLGVTSAGGTMTASIPLPLSVQRGLPIALQAVVNLGPTPALLSSVPTVLHVL